MIKTTPMFHRFVSNNIETGLGFKFGYESTNVAPDITYRVGECGGNFTTQTGIFTSPSFPDKYPSTADCVYTISRPNGTLIRITFMSMDLEGSDWLGCQDYLEIRDGKFGDSSLLDKVCSNDIPAPIMSTQNNVWMR